VLVCSVAPARAQCNPFVKTPPCIREGTGYNIELYQGPLLAPIHVMGVGGAYVASAEDTEGAAVNSAAPAVRDPYSTTWFDYDLSVGISFPGAFSNTDFDNHGDNATLPGNHASAGQFLDLNLGALLQFGELGFGATGDLQQFSLTSQSASSSLTMQIGRWKALGAYGLLDGQLIVGGGARIVTMQILQQDGGTLLTMTGLSPETGALVMPTGQPWRIGATFRAPVSGGVSGGVLESGRRAGGLVGPTNLVAPWETEFGIAYQLGPRPLNPGWENPRDQEAELRGEIERDRDKRALEYALEMALTPPLERAAKRVVQQGQEAAVRAIEDEHLREASEQLRAVRKARYANWPREKILLLASALVTGPSATAISVEGFLDQRLERVGQQPTVTPRLGIEGEPLRDRMMLRAGTYVEPSRYAGGSARQHFTFGADVRLFPLDFWGLLSEAVWKVGLFVDLAPRYQNAGIGLGNWH
jgi:hypothetical protein